MATTVFELARQFARDAEARGKIKGEGEPWKSVWLTEKQTAWLESLIARDKIGSSGGPVGNSLTPSGNVYVTHFDHAEPGDIDFVLGRRSKFGGRQMEYRAAEILDER